MTTIYLRLALLVSLAVLTACGGGSGASDTAATNPGATTPTVPATPTVTTPGLTTTATVPVTSTTTTSSTSPATGTTTAVTTPACTVPGSLRVDSLANLVAQRGEQSAMGIKQARVADPVRISLGPIDSEKSLLPAKTRTVERQQIGFARAVTATGSTGLTSTQWAWTTGADGAQSAALSFASEGAVAIRLGLVVEQLPRDAILFFYAPDSGDTFRVTGAAILDTLALNMQSDGDSQAARTYWSPTIEGVEAVVEIALPKGTLTSAVQISVPSLSHLQVLPQDLNSVKATIASCEIDVNCTTGFSTESNAIARVTFVATDGGTYVCTGTLLNDRAGTKTPYFLTANHCVSVQSEASSLNAYWFYKSSSCNASTLSSGAKLTTGGAALLYASSSTDTSFMRLNTAPPAGTSFAGWDATVPASGTPVVGLHNPSGGLQKISYGSTQGYLACSAIGTSDSFSCSPSTVGSGKFLQLGWSRGVTETGSSGSGIFKTIGGGNYLIGQLYGGSSSCTNLTGSDSYGRFDLAYAAALSKWLDPGACVSP